MNTRMICALFGVFFLFGQNSFAEEGWLQSEAKDNQLSENNAGVEEEKLLGNDHSYLPYLQLGGYRFFNLSTAKAAVGGDIFVPIWQSPSQLMFTHLRFFDRTGKPFEGNAHFGYRHLVPERRHLYGIYGAFDRKRTEFGNYFNQLTFGVEGWFGSLFMGGNYYQPIGETSRLLGVTESAHFERVQNNIWITQNKSYEKAMGGGDAEVGYEVVDGLVGYFGGYYFGAKDTNAICGPKARLTYDWSLENGKRVLGIFDKFGLEAGVQRDNPRGTTYYLSANIRVGLLPNRDSNLQGVARHMVDLVRRDPDINTGSSVETDRQPVAKLLELVGDKSEEINEEAFRKAINSPEDVRFISVKGNVNQLGRTTYRHVIGDKQILFGNDLLIVSPFSGKVLSVNIGLPSGTVGSISEGALNAFMGMNGGNEQVVGNSGTTVPSIGKKARFRGVNVDASQHMDVGISDGPTKRFTGVTIFSNSKNVAMGDLGRFGGSIIREKYHNSVILPKEQNNNKEFGQVPSIATIVMDNNNQNVGAQNTNTEPKHEEKKTVGDSKPIGLAVEIVKKDPVLTESANKEVGSGSSSGLVGSVDKAVLDGAVLPKTINVETTKEGSTSTGGFLNLANVGSGVRNENTILSSANLPNAKEATVNNNVAGDSKSIGPVVEIVKKDPVPTESANKEVGSGSSSGLVGSVVKTVLYGTVLPKTTKMETTKEEGTSTGGFLNLANVGSGIRNTAGKLYASTVLPSANLPNAKEATVNNNVAGDSKSIVPVVEIVKKDPVPTESANKEVGSGSSSGLVGSVVKTVLYGTVLPKTTKMETTKEEGTSTGGFLNLANVGSGVRSIAGKLYASTVLPSANLPNAKEATVNNNVAGDSKSIGPVVEIVKKDPVLTAVLDGAVLSKTINVETTKEGSTSTGGFLNLANVGSGVRSIAGKLYASTVLPSANLPNAKEATVNNNVAGDSKSIGPVVEIVKKDPVLTAVLDGAVLSKTINVETTKEEGTSTGGFLNLANVGSGIRNTAGKLYASTVLPSANLPNAKEATVNNNVAGDSKSIGPVVEIVKKDPVLTAVLDGAVLSKTINVETTKEGSTSTGGFLNLANVGSGVRSIAGKLYASTVLPSANLPNAKEATVNNNVAGDSKSIGPVVEIVKKDPVPTESANKEVGSGGSSGLVGSVVKTVLYGTVLPKAVKVDAASSNEPTILGSIYRATVLPKVDKSTEVLPNPKSGDQSGSKFGSVIGYVGSALNSGVNAASSPTVRWAKQLKEYLNG